MRTWIPLFSALYLVGCSIAVENALDRSSKDAAVDGDEDGSPPDPCDTETCECKENATCGAHARCALDTHTCECVPGYAGTGLNDCVWSSPIINGDFTTTDGWTLVGDAEIETAVMGQTAVGVATLQCVRSELHQTITMPERADAQPLVLEVTAKGDGFGQSSYAELGIGWNGHSQFLPNFMDNSGNYPTAFVTQRLCLGEAAFGGTMDLVVRSSGYSCSPSNHSVLDGLRIVPANADECPEPRVLSNPGFETAGVWTPRIFSNGGTGTAVLLDNVGQGGTRGARVASTGGASFGMFERAVSWPLQGGVALAFWWNPAASTQAEWLMPAPSSPGFLSDAFLFGRVRAPSTGGEFRRVCVPPWLRGLVTQMAFAVQSTPGCAGSCSATMDDIAFVDDAVCGNDPYLEDGGFENSGGSVYAASWTELPATAGASAAPGTGSGRTGGAAWFAVNSTCDSAGIETRVVIPPAIPGAGPAVTIWARASAPSATHVRLELAVPTIIEGVEPPAVSTASTSWAQTRICLPPNLGGTVTTLRFGVRGYSGSTCGGDTAFPQEIVYADDVALGTDPSCPTQ